MRNIITKVMRKTTTYIITLEKINEDRFTWADE